MRSTTCLCVCSRLRASKRSNLRCELFTIPQPDFPACFLFPWLPLGSHITKTFFDGRPVERAGQKVWDLGTRFSKVTHFTVSCTIHNLLTTKLTNIHKLLNTKIITLICIGLCIRRHKLIADWAQKIQCHKICAQSEARTQMGSWTSPLKVSSQGLFPPIL